MVKNKKTSKKLELDEKNVEITDKIMDPKIDFAFKELFGHNKTNFINLANAILHLEGDKKGSVAKRIQMSYKDGSTLA